MFDKHGKGILTWRELDMLMRALGFMEIPPSTLKRNCLCQQTTDTDSSETHNSSKGIDEKDFQRLLHCSELGVMLDYSFNRHNSIYNTRVLRKAVDLLSRSQAITMSDLRSARISFQFYEGEVFAGIVKEEVPLLNALSVANKAIAPRKLKEWLSTYQEGVPDRIQLYEFFDLVLLSENKEKIAKQISTPETCIQRNKSGIFDLADKNFLLTPDEKMSNKLDEEYVNMVSIIQKQGTTKKVSPLEAELSSKKGLNTKSFQDVQEKLMLFNQIKDAVKTTYSSLNSAKAIGFSGIDRRRTQTAVPRSRKGGDGSTPAAISMTHFFDDRPSSASSTSSPSVLSTSFGLAATSPDSSFTSPASRESSLHSSSINPVDRLLLEQQEKMFQMSGEWPAGVTHSHVHHNKEKVQQFLKDSQLKKASNPISSHLKANSIRPNIANAASADTADYTIAPKSESLASKKFNEFMIKSQGQYLARPKPPQTAPTRPRHNFVREKPKNRPKTIHQLRVHKSEQKKEQAKQPQHSQPQQRQPFQSSFMQSAPSRIRTSQSSVTVDATHLSPPTAGATAAAVSSPQYEKGLSVIPDSVLNTNIILNQTRPKTFGADPRTLKNRLRNSIKQTSFEI